MCQGNSRDTCKTKLNKHMAKEGIKEYVGKVRCFGAIKSHRYNEQWHVG